MKDKNYINLMRVGTWLALVTICLSLAACQNTVHAHIVGNNRLLDILYEAWKCFLAAIILIGAAIFLFSKRNEKEAKFCLIGAGVFVVAGLVYGYVETGKPCPLQEPGQLNDCPSYRNNLLP